jgi:Tfp pilus assembly protein PilV
MKNSQFKNQKLTAGFTLIEAFAAIIILLIAVLGPLTLLSRAISDGDYAKNQIVASFLLQEGLDLAVSNWNEVIKDNPGGDFATICTEASPCLESIDPSKGTITFSSDSTNAYLVCKSAATGPATYSQSQSCSRGTTDIPTIFKRKIWYSDSDIKPQNGEVGIFGGQIAKKVNVEVDWTFKTLDPRIQKTSTYLFK